MAVPTRLPNSPIMYQGAALRAARAGRGEEGERRPRFGVILRRTWTWSRLAAAASRRALPLGRPAASDDGFLAEPPSSCCDAPRPSPVRLWLAGPHDPRPHSHSAAGAALRSTSRRRPRPGGVTRAWPDPDPAGPLDPQTTPHLRRVDPMPPRSSSGPEAGSSYDSPPAAIPATTSSTTGTKTRRGGGPKTGRPSRTGPFGSGPERRPRPHQPPAAGDPPCRGHPLRAAGSYSRSRRRQGRLRRRYAIGFAAP